MRREVDTTSIRITKQLPCFMYNRRTTKRRMNEAGVKGGKSIWTYTMSSKWDYYFLKGISLIALQTTLWSLNKNFHIIYIWHWKSSALHCNHHPVHLDFGGWANISLFRFIPRPKGYCHQDSLKIEIFAILPCAWLLSKQTKSLPSKWSRLRKQRATN